MRRFRLPLVILAPVAIAALLAWLALSRPFGDRRPRGRGHRSRLGVRRRSSASQSRELAEITLVQDTNGPLVIGRLAAQRAADHARKVRG